MKRFKYGLTAFVAAALAACGGGGDEPQRQTIASACVARVALRVGLYGDSTNYGVDGVTHLFAVPTPTMRLQADMDAEYGPGIVTVTTRAVSGTTSTQLLLGTDGVHRPWPQGVVDDIVVMNHGINDSNPAAGVSVASYAQTIATIARTSPGIFIFETPNPVTRWDDAQYAQAMRDVADSLGAPLADANRIFQQMPGWSDELVDGIHPTGAGYTFIADNALMPTLKPIINKLLCR